MQRSDDFDNLRIELLRGRREQQRAALAKARELAQQDRYRMSIHGLLQAAAVNATFQETREAARSMLSEIDPAAFADDSQHMVRIKCNAGHEHYFDKRRLCADDGKLFRERGDGIDLIFVPCQEPGCTNSTQVKIDCAAYQ
jgi:hypothetical protein